jgi:hypothetical protein
MNIHPTDRVRGFGRMFMRPLSLISLVLVWAGCTIVVPRPPRVSAAAQAQAQAHAQAQATIRADVRVGVSVPQPPVRVPVVVALPPPPVPVPPQPAVQVEGAAVVEFFGIPLEGADDVVFILDCSGSMDERAEAEIAPVEFGDKREQPTRKIDVAQKELVDALERLPTGTRMNVIFFNEVLEAYAPTMVPLEDAGREALIFFVNERAPYGRTALAPAMRTAFMLNARRIVLLSDGLGNIGGGSEELLRDAREALRGGVRIDTVGLGLDQDQDLLRTLAQESGGLYQAF